MLIFKEETSRHKELTQTLTPLVQAYAKAMASPKAIFDLISRFTTILEGWDFSPKELKGLDRRAFGDLIRSWQADASAQDVALIKAVI
jgi:hypothetical protein